MVKREKFKTLFKNKAVSIKEITSPRSFTSRIFLQNSGEWIWIHQGSARLDIGGKKISLKSGQSYFIPPKVPHRILKTSPRTETVWYAVYVH